MIISCIDIIVDDGTRTCPAVSNPSMPMLDGSGIYCSYLHDLDVPRDIPGILEPMWVKISFAMFAMFGQFFEKLYLL